MKNIFSIFLLLFFSTAAFAQEETQLTVVQDTVPALSVKYDPLAPSKAAFYSAIVPGLGQVYNKKYWKIPIIYGALGITAGVFFYNVDTYRDLRFAYQAKYKAALPARDPTKPNQTGPFRDSTDYFKINPLYLPYDANSLRLYRDEFRSNIDYSVLVFILFWGLNVVDATVDAHLKLFDVNPDLSFKLKFGPSRMAGTTGLSFVLAIK